MYEESKEARGMTYTGLETYVQQAAFHKTLSRLYGAEGAEKAHSRCMEVMEEFYKTFDRPAEALFSAPGRTEIGGNHTDHQKGCVLAASVDLDILAAVAPTQSGIIRVLSQGYPMIEVDLRELDPKEEEINTSAALIRGVASCMSAMGCDLRERGLDVYMTSTVPKGSGLSSSAAYEVLMGTMLNELFWEGRCTAVELAQIGQYAENMFFGKPCGLMDQMASSVGGVVSIDFENTAHPAVEQLDVDLHAYGYALCILDSGAGHEDLTDEYSAITNEALRQGDFDKFLALVRESGRSSAMYLQNVIPTGSTAAQELMVTIALCERILEGRGAVRVHGGGFGGTAQAFVPLGMLDTFKKATEAALGKDCCHVVMIRPAGGVRLG